MQVYIVRRLLALIPTLFFASLIVFVTVRLIPGSVIDLMLSQNDIAVGKDRAQLEAALGLDRPMFVQYLRWAGGALRGDLGRSLWHNTPVRAQLLDLLPLVAGYLEKVGVKLEIQPMEYAAFLSAMTTKTNAPGYFMNNGHTNPTTSIRKSFVTGQTWNPSQWADPAFDRKMNEVYLTRDEAKRQQMIREMTVEILDKAPYVWLPTPYIFTAWWPWVQNYNGELRAGAVRPGPIYARIWIDQEMKKKMGF